MSKTRLNLSLDGDLVDFIKVFARENRTTAADVVTQYLLALKRRSAGDVNEMILSNPDIVGALIEIRRKLQNGAAKWHSFDETFK
jgi:hypothetical protein